MHIGGMPRTVEFILAFYKFMSYYQDEIFGMFPIYKKQNFGVKRKNYSSPFPFEEVNFKMDPIININDRKQVVSNFDLLFTYLTGGNSFSEYGNDLRNVEHHPQDPNGNQKWNIKHRYSFINFIPLIFGNKQTIEFRIHTPTYSPNKIIDFLMLNTYLIDYVSLNIKGILAGSDYFLKHNRLNHFLDGYVSKYVIDGNRDIYSELTHYVSDRRHRAEYLTREHGVTFNEKFVRPCGYLRLKPYEFYRGNNDLYEISGLSYKMDDLARGYFGENPFAEAEQALRQSAERIVQKKTLQRQKLKKSTLRGVSGDTLKTNGSTSSGGLGYFSWDGLPPATAYIPTDGTAYASTSSAVEEESKPTTDESNVL
jgi:hypothetical protein